MKNIFLTEIKKFDAPDYLADSLLMWGESQSLAWLAERLIDPQDKISDAISALAAKCNVPYDEVSYVYYHLAKRPLQVLQALDEFTDVYNVLLSTFDNRAFWDSFLPHAYRTAVRFACGELLATGQSTRYAMETCNLSARVVYGIRKKYLKPILTRVISHDIESFPQEF